MTTNLNNNDSHGDEILDLTGIDVNQSNECEQQEQKQNESVNDEPNHLTQTSPLEQFAKNQEKFRLLSVWEHPSSSIGEYQEFVELFLSEQINLKEIFQSAETCCINKVVEILRFIVSLFIEFNDICHRLQNHYIHPIKNYIAYIESIIKNLKFIQVRNYYKVNKY